MSNIFIAYWINCRSTQVKLVIGVWSHYRGGHSKQFKIRGKWCDGALDRSLETGGCLEKGHSRQVLLYIVMLVRQINNYYIYSYLIIFSGKCSINIILQTIPSRSGFPSWTVNVVFLERSIKFMTILMTCAPKNEL